MTCSTASRWAFDIDMGIWTDLWRTEVKGWAFGHIGDEVAIEANKRYVSIMLRQMRIVNARVAFSRFYGTVEFYGRIPHLSGAPFEFASVTTPSQLRDIRRKDLNNFVIGSKRLLGPVPYVGGDLEIEIGLFAIKSQDLLMPYLDLIEDLSTAAGLAFVNVAAPYIATIKKGATALIRPEGSASLEIGASLTFPTVQAGTYFAARLAGGGRDLSKFSLDDSGRLLDDQRRLVSDVPYLVFSITEAAVRDDWHQIPAVSAAYNQLTQAIHDQQSPKDIDSYIEHFRRVLLTDPDVLYEHAKQIVEQTERRINEVVRGQLTARVEEAPALPPLSEIELTPL
ncbi:MAG TPA: hypothetical protein VH084_10180 [Mycobacterium sp.]|jgi:hypothetical protein|nr:hypothetical protein [Mycobacterium sp.]